MVMRTPLSSFRCLEMSESASQTRFPSSPLIIRVPFFLLFGFNKGTQKEKGQKGTTGEPSKEAQAMAAALQPQVVPTCVALNTGVRKVGCVAPDRDGVVPSAYSGKLFRASSSPLCSPKMLLENGCRCPSMPVHFPKPPAP